MKAPNTTPAPPAATGPTPQQLHIIHAGEQAFQRGLATARNRGGPAGEIDRLCARPPEAPRLLSGERLTRMTLGIQRLMQKRAAMPDGMETHEIILFFARGPQAASLLIHYSEEDQAWSDPDCRQRYEDMVAEVDQMVDDTCFAAVSAWLNTELSAYARLVNDDEDEEPDKKRDARTSSGSSGSRVGWWLRAVEGICAAYAAACPAGCDLTQWAVWAFPVNDYFALQPAALERQGTELPEHYAVKEARVQRRKAKRAAAERLNAPAEPPPAPPDLAHALIHGEDHPDAPFAPSVPVPDSP
jgi:hypothetical protein